MESFANDDDNNNNPSSNITNLLCEEDTSCLNEEDDEHKVGPLLLNSQLVHDDSVNDDDDDVDDDYIQILVQKERDFSSNSCVYSSNFPSWLKDARFFAINWILNNIKSFGFQNQTAYSSIIYLDRFLSRRSISEDQSWAVVLVSVSCLSLAAKLEECKVPALSEYQVENYAFKGNVIQEMELMILSTLDWKMSLITPFVYIKFFIKNLGDQISKQHDFISRVIQLIMALIRESNSIEDYRPFVVAAAAVMAASDWQLTQDMLRSKISAVTLWNTSNNLEKMQEEEQLIGCYTLMQRLCSKDNPATPNLPEVDQVAKPPSLSGRKRSLSFRDSNQDYNLPD